MASSPEQIARLRNISQIKNRKLGKPTITCIECGGIYRKMSSHLGNVHGLTATEYRIKHKLVLGTKLCAPDTIEATRQASIRNNTAKYITTPEVRAKIATPRSAEYKLKISNTSSGRKRRQGLSEEHKAKIRHASSNITAEHRAKLSHYAKNRTAEHKAKLAACNKKKAE